jgi:hypothetical protein
MKAAVCFIVCLISVPTLAEPAKMHGQAMGEAPAP